MESDTIKVVAQRDAFLRIARARPLTALAELIWNSLDADANNVTVYFDSTELGLHGAIIEDDGLGAAPDEAKEFFRRLGGSWKKPGARTVKHGRVLHGSQGQGRYKALSIGRSIKWTYYYQNGDDILEFTLSILGDDPSEVRYSEPKKSDRDRTGCVVEINQISKYAASIEKDGRFAVREGVVWRYWVISDTLDEMGKWEAEKDLTGRGLIRDTQKSKIFIRTWDQLIEENKAKYQFIQERLNFSANDERAMSYLRNEYSALLDGVTVASDKDAT